MNRNDVPNDVPNDVQAEPSPLEVRSKALFDASVTGLNGNIRSRLTQARHAALAEAEQRPQPWAYRRWIPATGIAAAGLLAVIALLTDTATQRPLPDVALAADDMTILLDGDSLDLIEEMEFYAWLDSESGALEAIQNPSQSDPSQS